jgi:hypothetical protein
MLHHMGLPVVRCRASGIDVPGFIWYGHGSIHLVDRLIVRPLTFCSVRDPGDGADCATSHNYHTWQASNCRAMDLTKCKSEYHRHLDDLFPSPAHENANEGDGLPSDVQDIYQYRRNPRRVRSTAFHHRDWSCHHIGAEWTSHLCVWLRLEHVLRESMSSCAHFVST